MRSLRLLIGVLTLVVAGVVHAPDITTQVQGEMDRTDRRIEQAQSLVSASTRDAVQLELSEAIRIQASARTAYAEARYRLALDLTFRARARADRAIALE